VVLFRPKAAVLSDMGKGSASCQVSPSELNASEQLLKYRYPNILVKTGELILSPG